jgi:hypothetical protein
MKNKKLDGSKVKKFIVPSFLLFLLFCFVFLFAYSPKLRIRPVEAQIKSENQQIELSTNVANLQVVGSKIEGRQFVVTVRNNYEKTINSFFLTTGDISYHIDLLYSDTADGLMPFAERDLRANADNNLYARGLTIQAVLFEDGTGAGQSPFVTKMTDTRRGQKIALTEGKKQIDALLASEGEKLETDVKRVKNSFMISLSERSSIEENEDVKGGVDAGKQRFGRYLDDLIHISEGKSAVNLTPDIKKVGKRLEKYISKL